METRTQFSTTVRNPRGSKHKQFTTIAKRTTLPYSDSVNKKATTAKN